MVIRSAIGAEQILTALNVVPPSPSTYARFLVKFLDSPGEGILEIQEWVDQTKHYTKTPQARFLANYLASALSLYPPSSVTTERWRLPETISRQESMPFRAALTSARLRKYVDAWLETGRRSDGSEWPAERNLQNAFAALQAFLEYVGRAPVKLMISGEPGDADVVGYVAERRAYSAPVRNFFEAQKVEAQRLFVGIMASDWKRGLCKCRYPNCGRYFLCRKPRKQYIYGTFCCREHMRRASAGQAIRRARTNGTQALIDAAARFLLNYKIQNSGWQDDAGLKRRLARELCSVILRQRLHGYRREVKVNWITRHRETIERRRCEFSASD